MRVLYLSIFLLFITFCQASLAVEYSYSIIYMGQDDHEEFRNISRSTNLSACIAMLLRYHYRSCNISVLDVYRAGFLSYQHDGPAYGYKNMGFAPFELGFEVLDDEFKDSIGAGKNYSKRKTGYWSSELFSLDEVKEYLELWWGNVQVGALSFNSVVSEIKERPVIIKVKYNMKDDHFFLLKGYDDNDTPDNLNDDKFYVYDTYRNWTTKKDSNKWEIFVDGKGKFDYSTLSSWYKAAGNTRISFQSNLNKNQKRYSFIMDTLAVEIDKSAKNGNSYVWNEYFGSGNWYYPVVSGYSAKWSPLISRSGYYKLSIIYQGDTNPGGTITFVISASDHYSPNEKTVSISHSNRSGWQIVTLNDRCFFEKENHDISYIKIENVPANSRIDAIRFEFIDPVTEGLKYLTNTQESDGRWAYSNGSGDVGATSLAVWSFLNDGYSTDDNTVKKGIDYLLSKFQNNRFYAQTSHENYDTALAMMTLMATNNDSYNSYVNNAATYLKSIQSDDQNSKVYGGWSYSYTGKNSSADLSNSQFSIMALGYAEASGHESKFEAYLNRSQNYQTINSYCPSEGNDGGYSYGPCGGSSFSMTGAGLWGLYLIGKDLSTDQRAQKALSWIESNINSIYNGSQSMYTCLSFAKAMIFCNLSQYDQGVWYEGWYDKMSAAISKKQSTSGTWSDGWGIGPDTCFAMLALQTLQPPPDDLKISVKLASPANILVKDPEGNECNVDSCNISGAEFVIEDGHVQNVILPDLQSGTYSLFFEGTDTGTCHLTVKANLGIETVFDKTEAFDVELNDYLESDLIITSIGGEIDIHFDTPSIVPPPKGPDDKCKEIHYDLDHDHMIDAIDIIELTTRWSKFVKGIEYNAGSDFNNDSQIDIFDFMLISNCYGGQNDPQCYEVIECNN